VRAGDDGERMKMQPPGGIEAEQRVNPNTGRLPINTPNATPVRNFLRARRC
jgi:hypothetical protein